MVQTRGLTRKYGLYPRGEDDIESFVTNWLNMLITDVTICCEVESVRQCLLASVENQDQSTGYSTSQELIIFTPTNNITVKDIFGEVSDSDESDTALETMLTGIELNKASDTIDKGFKVPKNSYRGIKDSLYCKENVMVKTNRH